jgi:hypothetical protein
VYALAQILASYLAPIETALGRAQLDNLAARVGKPFDEVLGDGAQTWTLYARLEPGRPATVLVAPVADEAGVEAYARELADALPVVFPALRVKRAKASGGAAYTVTHEGREVVSLAVRRGSLVVADSSAALKEQLGLGARADIPGKGQAVAQASVSSPELARSILAPWWSALVLAAKRDGGSEAVLAAALAKARASLTMDGSSLVAGVRLGKGS